jgi:CcmD family protein
VRTFALYLFVGASLLILLPEVALGQESGLPDPQALGRQSLRGYSHMFAAYALAWLLIGGWIVSIARRLARLEKALRDE